MATTMHDRSSSVEDFLRNHRSRLNEDKIRMKNKEPSGGILPSDEGRSQSLQQRRNERQYEYRKYLQDRESGSTPSKRKDSDSDRPPSNTITEIRKQMQKEREKEIKFDGGTMTNPKPHCVQVTPTTTQRFSGLGGIGHRIEESPEEKRQRQSKYREELMQQMKEKTSRKMGTTKLFEEDTCRTPVRKQKQSSPPSNNRIKFDVSEQKYHADEDDSEDIRFNHNQYRPAQYREYPYYPPPGSHPPSLPLPRPHPPPSGLYLPPPAPQGSQYYSPYYYPTQFPHVHPSPHLQSYQPPYYPSYTNPYEKVIPTISSHHPVSPPHQSYSPPFDYRNYKSSHSPTLLKERKDKSIEQTDSRAEFRTFLDKQVKEKKEREAKEQREINKLYQKIEAEVYDPWGKPGGGAPLTDAIGNVVTERGQLRKSYDDNISPRMSEEDKKKLVQEKTKRELEEQIKENKERQMREKYERQRLDEEEERKIKDDLKKMNVKDKQDVKEERKKKQYEDQEKQKRVVIEEPLSAKELAELRFKEELEKKKQKEKEEKERLERLADKMACDSTPSWKQRNPSPPIPALQKNKRASEIPPYPTIQAQQKEKEEKEQLGKLANKMACDSTPLWKQRNPSPPIPALQKNKRASEIPPYPTIQAQTQSANVPRTISENHTQEGHAAEGYAHFKQEAQTPSNLEDHTHLSPQDEQHTTQTTSTHALNTAEEVSFTTSNKQLRNISHGKRNFRPSSLNKVRDDHMMDCHANFSSSATKRIANRQPSQELLQNFSVLKNQIRRTVSSTGGDAPPILRRQSQGVPAFIGDHDEAMFIAEPTRNIERRNSSDVARQRLSSGLSNFTIATMQIDSLANRNQERARRLDEIMNSSNRGLQNNPQEILAEFLQRRNGTDHAHHNISNRN